MDFVNCALLLLGIVLGMVAGKWAERPHQRRADFWKKRAERLRRAVRLHAPTWIDPVTGNYRGHPRPEDMGEGGDGAPPSLDVSSDER
jgi:hypothetical protein